MSKVTLFIHYWAKGATASKPETRLDLDELFPIPNQGETIIYEIGGMAITRKVKSRKFSYPAGQLAQGGMSILLDVEDAP